MFSLEINNFILIDHLNIDIKSGMNGLVGESGSGKSLIFKALDWLVNVKKDKEVIGRFDACCFVKITSKYSNHTYCKYVDIQKREFTCDGKQIPMRRFVETVSSEIHYIAQNSALSLFKGNNFIYLLDTNTADNEALLNQYHTLYDEYCLYKSLAKKGKDGILDDTLKEHYQTIIDNINTLPFSDDSNEQTYIEMDKKYQSIIKQKELFHQFNQFKSEIDRLLSQWSTYYSLYKDTDLPSLIHDISALKHHSENITLQEVDQHIDIDSINKKLYISSSLKRKFKVSSIEQLLNIKQNAMDKLEYADSAYIDYLNAQDKMKALIPKLERLSFQLHANRLFTLSKIESNLYNILLDLGLSHFHLNIHSNDIGFCEHGNTSITLSVNYNHLSYDIDHLSGGEKSRFLLAFYCSLNQNNNALLCFDEIDSGISGENAKMMARYLYNLSKHSPILLISHNPLIIAACNHCYSVYKENNDSATLTNIQALDNNGKIEAIAKLSSGSIDASSLKLATSLVANYE